MLVILIMVLAQHQPAALSWHGPQLCELKCSLKGPFLNVMMNAPNPLLSSHGCRCGFNRQRVK